MSAANDLPVQNQDRSDRNAPFLASLLSLGDRLQHELPMNNSSHIHKNLAAQWICTKNQIGSWAGFAPKIKWQPAFCKIRLSSFPRTAGNLANWHPCRWTAELSLE
jgi:hypothetical protein